MRTIQQSVELIQHTPEPAKLLERIARVCYNSEDRMACDCADGDCPKCRERRDKFLGGLAGKRHDSVFEHATATFKIITDRGITHELVRHRLASYTQSSTRYIKYTEGLEVVEPLFVMDGEREDWAGAMLAAEKAYSSMLERGVPAQNARDALPTCTATTIFMTANFREWRLVVELRSAKGAHPKIRKLAAMIHAEMMKLCPVYFKDALKD